MKKGLDLILLITLTLGSCDQGKNTQSDIAPSMVVPSPQQLEYQQMEMVGFIHFTVNTFTDMEWGFGDEDPTIFDPSELDVEQWVLSAKAGGLKELILTAKHHDGFCLWPSKYTEHSVKNCPYKNGKGDIVGEFVDACRKHGLKAGLYLSPWDRNHADYGSAEYIDYYRKQLTELLTEYGEINEIWFDGANGGDGYYGGAYESRKIDKTSYYDWENTFKLVYELQPNISVFSDAGPQIRWVGNEHGHAGETFWSTINSDQLVIGGSDTKYLNVGDPLGDTWIIGQCDVSIRPGWFYHASQDSLVKDPLELMDIYYKSLGRNGVLLLNLPPDKRGLIHENDVASLKAFKEIIDETFSQNLALGASVEASNVRREKQYTPGNITDEDPATYWAADFEAEYADLVIELEEEVVFDRVMLQEPIKLGQRICWFQVMVWQDSAWKFVYEGTTIGYKRILRIDPVKTSKIKIRLMESYGTIALSNVGLYKSSEKEDKSLYLDGTEPKERYY